MLPLFDEPAETFINNRTFMEQKSQFSSNPHMQPLQELTPNATATTLSREPREDEVGISKSNQIPQKKIKKTWRTGKCCWRNKQCAVWTALSIRLGGN